MRISEFTALDDSILYDIFTKARVPISTLRGLRQGVRRLSYLDAMRIAQAARQYINMSDFAEQCVLTNMKRFQTPLGCICAKAAARGETLQQRLDRVGIQRVRFNAMLSEPKKIRQKTRKKLRKAFDTPQRTLTDRDFEDHYEFIVTRESERASVQKTAEGICNVLCAAETTTEQNTDTARGEAVK